MLLLLAYSILPSDRFLKIGKYHQASRDSPLLDKVKPATFAGKYYYTKRL